MTEKRSSHPLSNRWLNARPAERTPNNDKTPMRSHLFSASTPGVAIRVQFMSSHPGWIFVIVTTWHSWLPFQCPFAWLRFTIEVRNDQDCQLEEGVKTSVAVMCLYSIEFFVWLIIMGSICWCDLGWVKQIWDKKRSKNSSTFDRPKKAASSPNIYGCTCCINKWWLCLHYFISSSPKEEHLTQN